MVQGLRVRPKCGWETGAESEETPRTQWMGTRGHAMVQWKLDQGWPGNFPVLHFYPSIGNITRTPSLTISSFLPNRNQ